jgi:hypothetical protein
MAQKINPYYSSTTTISANNLGVHYTTVAKAKYHILGEDVEIEGYVDGTTAMMISTLNVLGKPFYDELKKNNVSFSNNIEEYLKVKFKSIERENRIDSILDEKIDRNNQLFKKIK